MKTKLNINLAASIDLNLSEDEARALEALTKYGTRQFKEFFYKSLGKSYLEPHEEGLDSLFEKVKLEIPPMLRKIEEAQSILF